jgi:hypothetical protein
MHAAMGRPILPRPMTAILAGGLMAAEFDTGVPLQVLILFDIWRGR